MLKSFSSFRNSCRQAIPLIAFAGFIVWLVSLQSCSRIITFPSAMNVKKSGAVGDGVTDDTQAFQQAIDSLAALGGGTLIIPPGRYLINTDSSLKLRSHVNLLLLDTTAQLIAKPTNRRRFYVLLIQGVTDVNISGGRIIGERDSHLGDSGGEWGHGIAIYGSQRVKVSNMYISDCWGDGISLGAIADSPTDSVVITKVRSDHNRRQGLSIGQSSNVRVDSCEFTNTNGTKPMYGIDIEPDRDTARDISITNSTFYNNLGGGILMAQLKASARIFNVQVHGCEIHNNNYGGYLIHVQHVQFTGNHVYSNKYGPPIYATTDTVDCTLLPNNFLP